MKLLIEIPEEIYKASKIIDIKYEDVVQIPFEAIANGTPIPDNATNGDAIKVMFPSIESRLDEKTGIMLVKWTDGATKTFKASWWNSPYQKGGKE